MKNPERFHSRAAKGLRRRRGFALVVSLSLMVLLTVLAVGLMSLSAISLRNSTTGDAQAQAYANARLAVILALGQLQKNAGDDRRITADASISASAAQPQLVGAYTSWTHNFVSQPDRSIAAAMYTTQKNNSFRTWLASSPDPLSVRTKNWAETAPDSSWAKLFSVEQNGFDLSAPRVEMELGSLAWVVAQENTKAKVNVAGPDDADDLPVNAALQAQLRPSLESATALKQPDAGWNLRSAKVISMNQIGLDGDLAGSKETLPTVGKSYTVHSQGLLTDTVNGGLKVDLNLGFELGDSDFAKANWDNTPNPFRGTKAKAGFAVPSSFRTQMPLFRPLVSMENPIVTATISYDVASVSERFYGAAVPTFDHLRSYYRVAHHLYGGTNPPTVAERAVDHIASSLVSTPGTKPSPSRSPRGIKSATAIKPVLNRMVYLLSAALKADNTPQLVMTPIISLWNPYNTALEIEGAVAYPWIDVPFNIDWTFTRGATTTAYGAAMSQLMGKQFQAQNHGRQINPYFLCQISEGGSGNTTNPVRFEPGEVRVFAPASPAPVPFVRDSLLATKTIKMRPVNDVSQFTTKGGLMIPMKAGSQGFDYTMQNGDTAKVEVRESNAGAYHYFMTLEDATRIKTNVDENAQGGQATGDVQMLNFVSTANKVSSPVATFTELKTGVSFPFGVLESFHRTAVENVGGQSVADLVYTTNPRNPSITHLLTTGSFRAAPHYQTTLRAVSSFNGAIQTTSNGRNSFWGNSHSSSGQARLPFFDLPRQPMLSLANFQNADLASSPYAPAYQFANSWASAWLARNRAATRVQPSGVLSSVPVYDTCFLTNEALWDGYFFSGAAPELSPGTRPQIATAWDNPVSSESRSLKNVLEKFVEDPLNNPLGNPRMRLYGTGDRTQLVNELTEPAGCTKIAGHLMVDGAFNVNSTDVDAWVALLSGLRGQSFEVDGGTSNSASDTAFPRFRSPTGNKSDNWNGFRGLSDGQVRTLAENIVDQVKRRGPFLSLSEFVNRRIENSDLGRSGAIQSAIDAAGFNTGSKQANFLTTNYPADARGHIVNDTGVGIPGYLSQADVLQSLAPVITCRSDTFTIRGYGESKDKAGKVIARAWCEAVVQRVPDFVDPEDPADSAVADLTQVNQTYGRRFEIVSFRRVSRPEMQLQ